MPGEILVLALAGAFLFFVALIYQRYTYKKTYKDLKDQLQDLVEQLQEYKALFEISNADYKVSQQKIENLLEAASDKDVLLERGVNALTLANSKLNEQVILIRRLVAEIEGFREKLEFQEEQYTKLMSQKKSSEVRTGKIAEQISPFLSDYPLDPRTARFIGDPIDFVHFDEDKVTFVEVKSGKSQLSTKQRRIRNLIKDGKVEFTIYRVEGK